MLKDLNNLKPFFEDCYRQIHIREYARLMNISPPTASTLLSAYEKNNLLKKEEDKKHFLFSADRENRDFIDLSRIYWRHRLKDLLDYIEKQCVHPTIILFGSLAKAETTPHSDIDICVLTPSRKKLGFQTFEKQVKRTIHVFSPVALKSDTAIQRNIINGYVMRG